MQSVSMDARFADVSGHWKGVRASSAHADSVAMGSDAVSSITSFCDSANPHGFLSGGDGVGGNTGMGSDLIDTRDARGIHAGLGLLHGYFAADESSMLLDDITRQKVENMVNQYEALFESQLEEQRVYFEKLLAAETTKLLTQTGYVGSPLQGKSKTSSILGMVLGSDGERSSIIGTADISVNGNTGDAEAEAERMFNLKLDISALESEHDSLLECTRNTQKCIVQLKKENDQLIRCQKQQRARVSELKSAADDCRRRKGTEEADLKQQIVDLNFYRKTQADIQSSPLRDEINGGGIIIVGGEASPASTVNNKNSKLVKRRGNK